MSFQEEVGGVSVEIFTKIGGKVHAYGVPFVSKLGYFILQCGIYKINTGADIMYTGCDNYMNTDGDVIIILVGIIY